MISDNIEDFQREEALNLLAYLFTTWTSAWNSTTSSLSTYPLSESTKRRIHFYETAQKEAVLSLLATILVAWDTEDRDTFSSSVISLARELRPSLPYLESDPEEDNLILTPSDLSRLRSFMARTALLLKNTVSDLKALSSRRFRFDSRPLSFRNAQALLEEKLGIKKLDLLTPSEEI